MRAYPGLRAVYRLKRIDACVSGLPATKFDTHEYEEHKQAADGGKVCTGADAPNIGHTKHVNAARPLPAAISPAASQPPSPPPWPTQTAHSESHDMPPPDGLLMTSRWPPSLQVLKHTLHWEWHPDVVGQGAFASADALAAWLQVRLRWIAWTAVTKSPWTAS